MTERQNQRTALPAARTSRGASPGCRNALPAVTPPPLPISAPPVRIRAGFPQVDSRGHQNSIGDETDSSRTWFERNTSFAISLIANLSLLVALALWQIHQPSKSQHILLTSVEDLPVPEQIFELEKSAELEVTENEVFSAAGGDLTSLPDAPTVAAITEFNPLEGAPGESDSLADQFASDLMQQIGGGQGGGGSGGAGPAFGDASLMEFVDRLQRAGAKTGDVQVSLIWDNFNDLDLHVITPKSETIFFGHRRSRCRGLLDVDMNAGRGISREPVENIYWAKGKAPTGRFRVYVHHYRNHGDPDPTAFELRVLVDGETKVIRGETAFPERRKLVYEFTRLKGIPSGPASTAAPSPNDDFPLRD